jgi:dolichol kinase
MADNIIITEVQRKLFHSLMLVVAAVNWIGGPLLSIGFTGICLAFLLGFDFLRIRVYGYFPFRGITDRVVRPAEKTRLGASVYFAVGTLFTLLSLFLIGGILQQTVLLTSMWIVSGWLAIAAVVVAALGDAGAAIVGKLIGRHRLGANRTVEGTIGGFIIGFLSFLPFWYLFDMPYFYGLIAAGMLVLVEVSQVPLNDNLLNPIAIGFSLTFIDILLIFLATLGVI